MAKRGRGRPRKSEMVTGASPQEYQGFADAEFRMFKDEYFKVPELLSYNSWHTIAGVKNSSHTSSNPEVKTLHFNGMSTRYKQKFAAALDSAFSSYFAPDTTRSAAYSYNAMPKMPEKIPGCTLSVLDEKTFHEKVGLDCSFNMRFNGLGPMHMVRDHVIPFPSDETVRTGFAVNCGGLPVSSCWFDKDLQDKHYLLVSVISVGVPVPSQISSAHLQSLSLSSFTPYNAALVVYEFDERTVTLMPVKHILLERGAITQMEWLLSGDESESLLGCVFADGTAGVIRVDAEFLSGGSDFCKLESPSVHFNLNSDSFHHLQIQCCTWTSATTLLVGTTQGCVAELDITTGKPLYILPLASPSILALKSDYSTALFGEPLTRSNNILLASGDLEILFLDLANPTALLEGTKFRIPIGSIAYSSFNNGFVYADGTRSPKVSTVRDPSSTMKLKVYDEPAQSIGCCDFSSLVLVGCVNGAVRLINFHYMLGQPVKSNNTATLRLYKLDSVKEDGNNFRLNLGYLSTNKETLSNEYPPFENSLTVTSCAMKNSPRSHDIIASMYGCGLLLVEKLQSV